MSAKKRILFVEDDPLLLDTLQEALADAEDEWDMAFVDSGDKALAAFAERPFDMIVSDLWMPGMNGAELLQKLLARYPGTVRIVLSGNQDREMAIQVVGSAHQFLSKPCDPRFLKSTIRRTWALGSEVHSDHAKELVARIGKLPSVPLVFQTINSLLDSDRATVDNLGLAISKDMAMTAMILKIANSAFFGLRHTVSTPSEAVAILGVDLLKSLVLAHGLFSQAGAFHIPTFTLNHLWQHSLGVAGGAKALAERERLGAQQAGEFFTAGLLHDVGILVLASRFPDEFMKVLETVRTAGGDLETAEFHVLGVTHGEVGSYLLGLWGLPPAVVQAAAWHHRPRQILPRAFNAAMACHIADAMLAADADHEIFSTSCLEEDLIREIGLHHRLPEWQSALEGSLGRIDAMRGLIG